MRGRHASVNNDLGLELKAGLQENSRYSEGLGVSLNPKTL